MSIREQYLGFLESKSLLQVKSLLEIPLFDFEKLTTNSSEVDIFKTKIPDNEVLGKRIEHFFENCIMNSKQYTLICKNKQVFKNKITVGELDFIIKDISSKKVMHVELVYKFYLYDPKISMVSDRWIGPNRKDSLQRKIEKLKSHQFPLLYREETLPILEELQLVPQEIHQEVCYLGNLFVPVSYQDKTSSFPETQCMSGYWMRENEFTSEKYGNFQFFIPKKQNWVSNPKFNKTWVTYTDILKPLKEELGQKKSPLLWIKRNKDSYERMFIVWW